MWQMGFLFKYIITRTNPQRKVPLLRSRSTQPQPQNYISKSFILLGLITSNGLACVITVSLSEKRLRHQVQPKRDDRRRRISPNIFSFVPWKPRSQLIHRPRSKDSSLPGRYQKLTKLQIKSTSKQPLSTNCLTQFLEIGSLKVSSGGRLILI